MEKYFKYLILLIFFISLSSRLYWGFQKQGLHIDEVLSATISNHNEAGLSLSENTAYDKKRLLRGIFFDKSSIKDADKDIKALYYNNVDYLAHTNFYYTLLRLAFIGRSTFDLKNIILTGILLNCVLFTAGFFFLYKLMGLLFEDKMLVLVGLFCSSIAGGAVSISVFLRPYQLQSTMLITLTYIILYIFVRRKFNLKAFIFLGLSVAGALLSGYFSIIFIALCYLFILMYYFIHKNFKRISFYFTGLLFGAFLTQLLYPKYWQTILNGQGRAGEAYSKVTHEYIIGNALSSIKLVFNLLSDYAVYNLSATAVIFFVYCLYTVFFKKMKININYLALAVVTICLLFSIIVMELAPYKVMRYIMPVFPLIVIIIPLIIGSVEIIFIRNAFFALGLAVYALNAFNITKINYLYQNKLTESRFLGQRQVSICVFSPWQFRFLEWIPYAKDKQKYYFFVTPPDIYSNNFPVCDYAIIDTIYNSTNEFGYIYNQIDKKYVITDNMRSKNDDIDGYEMFKLELR